MFFDYKYAIQQRAEELASQRYGEDYYDLPEDLRETLYEEAYTSTLERGS